MHFKVPAIALAILTFGQVRSAAAQAMVSFDVPLNLTQVNVDIQRIRVVCMVNSEAIVPAPIAGANTSGWGNLITSNSYSITGENLPPNAARQEMWVFGGQVVATVRVIVSIPAEWLQNPVGKKAQYICAVMGYSTSTQKWGTFSDQSTELPFKLKVTPEMIAGEFIW